MWGISILADLRPMACKVHAVVVFGLGKNLLSKSVVGHFDLVNHSNFLVF